MCRYLRLGHLGRYMLYVLFQCFGLLIRFEVRHLLNKAIVLLMCRIFLLSADGIER